MNGHQCHDELPEESIFGGKMTWKYRGSFLVREDGTGLTKCPDCDAERWQIMCVLQDNPADVDILHVTCRECGREYGSDHSVHLFFTEYYLNPKTAKFMRAPVV